MPAASCGLPASIGRAALNRSRRSGPCGLLPLDLAPGGVYQAAQVALSAGGLLHHRFTLTPGRIRRRSVFCGTIPRVTPGRRYRPPCPAEPGPSSARQANLARRGRPASSPAAVLRIRAAPPARRNRKGGRYRHVRRHRPPHTENCELSISESGCPAGCRTHRCSATALARTAIATTQAASLVWPAGLPGGLSTDVRPGATSARPTVAATPSTAALRSLRSAWRRSGPWTRSSWWCSPCPTCQRAWRPVTTPSWMYQFGTFPCATYPSGTFRPAMS